MPFTPIHMGPGILIKAVLQSSFSLMVFGWAQIMIDIQPLIVLITGKGYLHGFTHTYLGAILIGIISALTGKHFSEFGLKILGLAKGQSVTISWRVAFLSAFIGSFSHVMIDSIAHADVQPFYPMILTNNFHGFVSNGALHKFCLYSGFAGAIVYYLTGWILSKK